ncbi:MAG: energy transducer TonB [Pyrinomonadaceae bacterium]
MKHSLCFLIFIVLFSATAIFAQSETEKGIELYRSGDFSQAVVVLDNTVKVDKKDRKAWTYLGASYFKTGNRKEAANAFKKAASISVPKESLSEINDGLVIKTKPRAHYTDAARENFTQGVVKIAVEFGQDGKIKSAYIIQGLPNGLTEECIEAVKKIEFEPVQKDGKPISVVGIIEYSFTIY